MSPLDIMPADAWFWLLVLCSPGIVAGLALLFDRTDGPTPPRTPGSSGGWSAW